MRPWPITLLCVLVFAGAALKLLTVVALLVVHPSSGMVGPVLWTLSVQSVALVSMLGLWHMRRWGVYLYLGGYAVATMAFYVSPHHGSGLWLSETFRPNNPLLVFFQQHPSWNVLARLLALVLVWGAIVLPYWRRLRPMQWGGHRVPR